MSTDHTTGLEAIEGTDAFQVDVSASSGSTPQESSESTSVGGEIPPAPSPVSSAGDGQLNAQRPAIEFRVTRPGTPNRRLRLTGDRYTFGNAEGCSIRLSDLALRPMHAVLIRDAARILVRAYSVPVLVNGQRKTESSLHVGDLLELGDYRFELLDTQSTSDAPGELDPDLFSTMPHSIFDRPGVEPGRSSSRPQRESEQSGRGSIPRQQGVPNADDLMWRERLRREVDQWRDRQSECDRRENRCDERESDLRNRESELWTRAENLYRRESRLQSQEAAAFQLYDEFTQRQEELLRLREEAQNRQESFNRREAEFRNIEFEYRHRLEDAARQLHQSQQQAESATQSVQRMRAQFESLNRQIEELSDQQQTIDHREQAQRDEHDRIRVKLEEARDEAIERSSESDRRRIDAEARVDEMAAQLAALQEGGETDLKAHRKQLQESELLVDELREQVEQLQQSVEEASQISERYRNDYEQAKESVQQLESLVAQNTDRSDKDREAWESETDELRSSIERLSEDLARANGELTELRLANENLTNRLDEIQIERDQAKEDLAARPTAEQVDSLESELQDTNDQLTQLRDDYQQTLNQLEQTQKEHAEREQQWQAELLVSAAPQPLPSESDSAVQDVSSEDQEPASFIDDDTDLAIDNDSDNSGDSNYTGDSNHTADGELNADIDLSAAIDEGAASEATDSPSVDQADEPQTSAWGSSFEELNADAETASQEIPTTSSDIWGDAQQQDASYSESTSDRDDLARSAIDSQLDEPQVAESDSNSNQDLLAASNDPEASLWPDTDTPEPKAFPLSTAESTDLAVDPADAGEIASDQSIDDLQADDVQAGEAWQDPSGAFENGDLDGKVTDEPTQLDEAPAGESQLDDSLVDDSQGDWESNRGTTAVWGESSLGASESSAAFPWNQQASSDSENEPEPAASDIWDSARNSAFQDTPDAQLDADEIDESSPSSSDIWGSNTDASDAQESEDASSTDYDESPSQFESQESFESQDSFESEAPLAYESSSPVDPQESSSEFSETGWSTGPDSNEIAGQELVGGSLAQAECDDSIEQETTDPSSDGSLASRLIQDFESENSGPTDSSLTPESIDDGGNVDATQQWDSTDRNWDQEHSEELYASEWSNNSDGFRVEQIDPQSPLDEEAVESAESDFDSPHAESYLDDSSEAESFNSEPETDEPATGLSESTESGSYLSGSEQDEQASTSDEAEFEDDDSIEAYMNRLLQRVQAPGNDSESDPTTAPISESSESDLSLQGMTDSAPADEGQEEIEELDPTAPLVPRSQAPEKTADLSALRALANQTARNAITRSARVQSRDIQLKGMVSFGCAAGALVCGFACYSFLPGVIKFVAVAMTMIVAAVYGKEGVQLLLEANSRIRNADSSDNEPDNKDADEVSSPKATPDLDELTSMNRPE